MLGELPGVGAFSSVESGRRVTRAMSVDTFVMDRRKCGYLPVEVATLASLTQCDFNLYNCDREGRFVLFRERALAMAGDDFRQLSQGGLTTLYISLGDCQAFAACLHQELARGDDLAPLDRCRLLKEATRSAYENAMRTTNVVEVLKITDTLAQQLTEGLCSQEFLFGNLFDLVAHDFSAFTHATNVSTYCLLLAARLGISSKKS